MSDDEYEIPLRDQRYFGSGLKRKRVHFISSSADTTSPSVRSQNEVSAAEKYLAIVLGKRTSSPRPPASDALLETCAPGSVDQPQDGAPTTALCPICSKAIDTDDVTGLLHSNSLVHQICMTHSHPPSHIDRDRKGLAVLQSYGWDPDKRRGLGAGGEGILHPVKARENLAKLGLGAQAAVTTPVSKPVRLDAGKVREMERDAQKQKDKLRAAFYQNDDVEKYLGEHGES